MRNIRSILLLSFLLLGLGSCSVFKGLTAFSKCEFRYHSTTDLSFCRVSMEGKQNSSDFSFQEGVMIMNGLLSGDLPFQLTVNIEARNPGTETAAVSRVEWIALLDDQELTRGVVEEEIRVESGGGSSLIPLDVSANLIDYLEGEQASAIRNFVLNLMNAGSQESELKLKIKPSVRMGSMMLNYPGYFVLTEEFSSGE